MPDQKPKATPTRPDPEAVATALYKRMHRKYAWFWPLLETFAAAANAGHSPFDVLDAITPTGRRPSGNSEE